MHLVLLYRWAGGGAEEDIYKMDQFPFGKGKPLFPLLLPVLFCLLAQTSALLLRIENPPPLIASFTSICIVLPHFMWLFSKTPLSQSWDQPWQLRPHTVFLTCLHSFFFFFFQFWIACSMDLPSFQLWFSHFSIVNLPRELLSVI